MNSKEKIPVYCVYDSCHHSPLGLGMIISYAKSYKNGVLEESYKFVPEPLTSRQAAAVQINRHGPGILLASDYVWSSIRNREISKLAKSRYQCFTIHGGPQVPKYDYECQTFLESAPYVDVAVRGEGEVTTAELLEKIASPFGTCRGIPDEFLAKIEGITYRSTQSSSRSVIRTNDRERIQDLDDIPSPYLSGWFHTEDAKQWVAAIVETNRGCPYGCSFCDWGSATLAKIRTFSLERVHREIEWLAHRGVSTLWIADANFGILKRDVEIAQIIAELKQHYGNPKQVIVNYAKNATARLAEITGILFRVGIAVAPKIALQTQDATTLENVQRSNIKTERYDELIGIFKEQNLTITSDIMIGLPGATVESFVKDLQFFFDRKVFALAFKTMVLPNSPMAHKDYMAKYQIQVNGIGEIVSSYSFTKSDKDRMVAINAFYRLFVGFSTLKYFLYYLQLDHGIRAIKFISDLQYYMEGRPQEFAQTRDLVRPLLRQTVLGTDWPLLTSRWEEEQWQSFYREIVAFVALQYGVIEDSAMNAMLQVQLLLMPRKGRNFPDAVYLEHDVVTYFQPIRTCAVVRDLSETRIGLKEYSPGRIEVEDPNGLCSGILEEQFMMDYYMFEWELRSPLRFGSSIQHYIDRPA